jgi:hypothetical protein
MKKIFILILSGLLLSSCAPKVEVLPELPDLSKPAFIPFKDPTGTVSSADTATRFINNNFFEDYNWDNHETTSDGVEIQWNTLVMDGLIDETIESSINQLIEDKITEYKKYVDFKLIPPYDGMYVKYPLETTIVESLNISVYAQFNYNNILSLAFYVDFITNVPPRVGRFFNDLYVSDQINIDLNTGDEINFSDLFINGSNYVQAINELVLVDLLSKVDPEFNQLDWNTSSYKGGFGGIRGDVDFGLYYEGIHLCFDQEYTEFTNPTCVYIPFSKISSILAFGQRFMTSEGSLFTNKIVGTQNNYLYPNNTTTETETINGVKIIKSITRDDELSSTFVKLRDKLINQGETTINKMIYTNIESLYYVFEAVPVGPYMTVKVNINTQGMDASVIRTERTYRQDGSVIGYNDIFKAGTDYRTYLKTVLTKYIKDYLSETYDLDELIDTLQVSLIEDGINRYIHLSNYDNTGPTMDFSEGEFDIRIDLDEVKDMLKIEKWFN